MDRADEVFHGDGDPWSTQVTRARMLWMAQWARGPIVIDWGCGQGTIFHLLENKVDRYVGCDSNAEAIAYARAKNPKATFTTKEAELPESASSILLGEVLEHVEAPRPFLEKAACMLERPGGRLVVTVPHGFDECNDHRHVFGLSSFLDLVPSDLHVVFLGFADGFIRAVIGTENVGFEIDDSVRRAAERDLFDSQRRAAARFANVMAYNKQLVAALAQREKQVAELEQARAARIITRLEKRVRTLLRRGDR